MNSTLRHMTLGDVLAEERLIARTQLKQAQRAADRSGAPLIAVLVEQGLVEEDALVSALRKHLEIDTFDPVRTEVDVDAIREIPVDEANRYRLLPVRLMRRGGRRVLRVAMADPLDHQAVEEIEFATGCNVEPLIARPSDLVDAIRSHYRSVVTKIIPRGATPNSSHTSAGSHGAQGRRGGSSSSSAPANEASGAGSASNAKPRTPFGGGLTAKDLHTRPVRRVQQDATVAHRVDALVALLIRKGLISQDEYEEQLASLVPTIDE